MVLREERRVRSFELGGANQYSTSLEQGQANGQAIGRAEKLREEEGTYAFDK